MRLDASPLVIVGYAAVGGFCGALAGMFVAPCCLGAIGIAAWGALGGGIGWSVGAGVGTTSSWNGRTSEASARGLVALAMAFVVGGVAVAAWMTTVDRRAAPVRREIVLLVALDVVLMVATCLTVARTSLSSPGRACILVVAAASTLAIVTVVLSQAFI